MASRRRRKAIRPTFRLRHLDLDALMLGPIDGYTPDGHLEVNRSTIANQYEDFTNCLDDGFATAARTLSTLSHTYGANNPSVMEWTRGQDAVFSNCGDGRSREYFGPGKPPLPPVAPHLPSFLPVSAPLWLRRDRAYQLAAAHFSALDFTAAITGFRTVAADEASPWSVVSRYLIARVLIRESTLADFRLSEDGQTAVEQASTESQLQSGLAQAQEELLAMRNEPRMVSMLGDIDKLLDYVNLRLQPEAQAAVLAHRLQSPGTGNFGQSLIDLTWLRTNQSDPEKPAPPLRLEDDPARHDRLDRGPQYACPAHQRLHARSLTSHLGAGRPRYRRLSPPQFLPY